MNAIEIPIGVFNTDNSHRHEDFREISSLVDFMKELYTEYLNEIGYDSEWSVGSTRLLTASETTADQTRNELMEAFGFQNYLANKEKLPEVVSFYSCVHAFPESTIKGARYVGIVLEVNGRQNGIKRVAKVLYVSVHMRFNNLSNRQKVRELRDLKERIDTVKNAHEIVHVIIAGDFNIETRLVRTVFSESEYNYATNESTTTAENSCDNIITSRSVRISDVMVRGENSKVDKSSKFRQIFQELCETLECAQDLLHQAEENLSAKYSNYPFQDSQLYDTDLKSYQQKGLKLCESIECNILKSMIDEILSDRDYFNCQIDNYDIQEMQIRLQKWLEKVEQRRNFDPQFFGDSLCDELNWSTHLCKLLTVKNFVKRYKFNHFPLFAMLQLDLTESARGEAECKSKCSMGRTECTKGGTEGRKEGSGEGRNKRKRGAEDELEQNANNETKRTKIETEQTTKSERTECTKVGTEGRKEGSGEGRHKRKRGAGDEMEQTANNDMKRTKIDTEQTKKRTSRRNRQRQKSI